MFRKLIFKPIKPHKHDRKFIDIRGTFFNSSVMCWNRDQCEHIFWEALQEDQMIFKTFYKLANNSLIILNRRNLA